MSNLEKVPEWLVFVLNASPWKKLSLFTALTHLKGTLLYLPETEVRSPYLQLFWVGLFSPSSKSMTLDPDSETTSFLDDGDRFM